MKKHLQAEAVNAPFSRVPQTAAGDSVACASAGFEQLAVPHALQVVPLVT